MKCPKCGGVEIVTRYHGDRQDCGYTACAGARWDGFGEQEPLYAKEHLARRCGICHYRWATPTVGPTEKEDRKP